MQKPAPILVFATVHAGLSTLVGLLGLLVVAGALVTQHFWVLAALVCQASGAIFVVLGVALRRRGLLRSASLLQAAAALLFLGDDALLPAAAAAALFVGSAYLATRLPLRASPQTPTV